MCVCVCVCVRTYVCMCEFGLVHHWCISQPFSHIRSPVGSVTTATPPHIYTYTHVVRVCLFVVRLYFKGVTRSVAFAGV